MQNYTSQCDQIRVLNCKSFEFEDCESYPQIKPAVSPCCVEKKVDGNAVANKSCGSLFNMDEEDVMDVWKRSPKKESLSYYGVDSDKKKPEAIAYNEVVAKCLSRVSVQKQQVPKLTKKAEPNLPKKCRGNNVLNQQLLMAKISQMPNVQKFLRPGNAPYCFQTRYPKDSPKYLLTYRESNAATVPHSYEKLYKDLLICFD